MFTAPEHAPAVPIAPAVSVPRKVRCCNISGAAIPGRPAHRIYMPPLSTDRLVGAHLIIVQAVSMADTMPAGGAFVHAMLAAVALGKAVIAVKDWEGCSDPLRSPHCVRHEAACESVPTSLAITSSFSKKHGMTRQLLTKCSEAENSQWTVTILDDGGTKPCGAVLIHTQMDVYALVRRVRRIFPQRRWSTDFRHIVSETCFGQICSESCPQVWRRSRPLRYRPWQAVRLTCRSSCQFLSFLKTARIGESGAIHVGKH